MFVDATPMRSIDGMTTAVAADIMSDRTALTSVGELVQSLTIVQYFKN
jgi:hypothetical protein